MNNYKRPSLIDLEMHGDFLNRHIGSSETDISDMLDLLGINSLDQLIQETVPQSILVSEPLNLTPARSERETSTYLRHMRRRNKVFISMIGCGYYGTVMPSVIKRNVLENPDWYTAYTPYQAEVSQGRLEVLLAFQHMVSDLTGMQIANASLLDEGTAAAEAMAMAKRISKNTSNTFFVDVNSHPQTISVLKTRAQFLGFKIILGHPLKDIDDNNFFGALIQYPTSMGYLYDLSNPISTIHEKKAIAVVATDLLALTLLKPPGEFGADVVVGNSQRFGVPMGYGGPHAAFFATRESFVRSIPGRMIGVSIDSHGKQALRMALQTREQHIRREKATSNICTAQVLLANLSALYAMYHGPKGLKAIASRVHRMTMILSLGLTKLGYTVNNKEFFDTIEINVPGMAGRIAARARESKINLRLIDQNRLAISLDETTKRKNIRTLWQAFSARSSEELQIDLLDNEVADIIPSYLQRTSSFLEHEIFNSYHSETEMMRFMRRTASKDISLGRSMIPLGSCTMKLNSTTQMISVSHRSFSNIHPFAPLDQTQGYQQLFDELESMLCEITGFDAISLQPNAGSQGEYTGLLCILKLHESRGQPERNICLIPESAHGTNPASAVLAGMQVVVVNCDHEGNIDINDLTDKAIQYQNQLGALMITYPSTHGVFEENVTEICDIIHKHGGQVYMDGANLNALVGVCRPVDIGADVVHINLHKTFAIPHGGGGPGMGPIGVRKHLARFLPDHPVVEGVNPAAGHNLTVGTVSSAPWGSASILPISWAYIAMLGPHGLRKATEVAILNANYIAKRLKPYYPILYTGTKGWVAHECIIDLKPIRTHTGITVEDIAKRLVDFGFHAPTMSWPVPDSFMIEPTESESKSEIDRFCDAMIIIRKEITEIESGVADKKNNLLKNAPHSIKLVAEDEWPYPYSQTQAFFPAEHTLQEKYWPPVGRIDGLYGDKNLVCMCPPVSTYNQEET